MTITIFGRGGGKRRGEGGLFSPLRPRPRRPKARPKAPGAAGAPASSQALRLMSLNIAHARRKARHQSLLSEPSIRRNLALIAGVIEREEPHVVALQEADGPSSWSGKIDHVETISALAGYAHAFRGEHNHPSLARLDLSYGTALLSRLPLEAPRSHAFRKTWRDTKGFVAATISTDVLNGESIDVVSIHLDFLADRVRRLQVEQLVDTFRGHSRHLVVMGDFNCAWGERRRSLDLLHHELKLRPFAEVASPTYPAWRPLVRLDWILISEGLEFASHETLGDRVSDHLGIVADIRARGAQTLRPATSRERETAAQPRRLPSVSLA
jgi:endonuclease/exonuclease/phosphatase family metal-dependent hydrolase